MSTAPQVQTCNPPEDELLVAATLATLEKLRHDDETGDAFKARLKLLVEHYRAGTPIPADDLSWVVNKLYQHGGTHGLHEMLLAYGACEGAKKSAIREVVRNHVAALAQTALSTPLLTAVAS